MHISDWFGMVGVAITLLAYFCGTFEKIRMDGKLFFLLNTIGSALSCFGSWLIPYWPFVVLEGTWAVVSLAGFLKAKARI
jgi:hypothetical protein